VPATRPPSGSVPQGGAVGAGVRRCGSGSAPATRTPITSPRHRAVRGPPRLPDRRAVRHHRYRVEERRRPRLPQERWRRRRRVLRADLTPQPLEQVTADADRCLKALHRQDERLSVAAQQAALTATPSWRASARNAVTISGTGSGSPPPHKRHRGSAWSGLLFAGFPGVLGEHGCQVGVKRGRRVGQQVGDQQRCVPCVVGPGRGRRLAGVIPVG
jgi:hypothetical protein